jgi:hypothetical protein
MSSFAGPVALMLQTALVVVRRIMAATGGPCQ